MRISRILPKVAVGIVCLAVLNMALAYALIPYGSKSELVWTDYKKEAQIDTVIVGTSLMQHAINPYVLDEELGTKSYCLATPNQTLEESLIAIQTAYQDHGITRVILGTSAVNMQEDAAPSLGDAFLYNRSRVVSPAQSVQAAAQVLLRYGGLGEHDSIDGFFPWIYNHVEIGYHAVKDNIGVRMTMDLYQAAEVADPVWKYRGKGYGACLGVLDYSSDYILPYFGEESLKEGYEPDYEVNPKRVATLRDICTYCQEHGIRLTIVAPPVPVFNTIDGEGYAKLSENVAREVAACGLRYYDFNYAGKSLFVNDPTYYFDTLHMNEAGGTAFTKSFAQLVRAEDAGDDMDALFIDPAQLAASIDYVSALFATADVRPDGIHVKAHAVTGPDVGVEYRLSVVDAKTDEVASTVRDWQDSPEFVYAPDAQGVVKLRVEARPAGSGDDGIRSRNLKVFC